MNKPGNPSATTHTDVQISVTDFGPITSGTVDLRPLTVFVGPSNTGKTYFAILIYALQQILPGFPRIPIMHHRRYHFGLGLLPDKSGAGADVREKELKDVLEKLDTEGRPFRFSDLPGSVRDVAQASLKGREWLGSELQAELERCFDLESVSDLIRFSGDPHGMKVSLAVSEENRDIWRFHMGISESGITTDGRIEDMIFLPEGWSASELKSGRSFSRFWPLIEEIRRLRSTRNRWYVFESLFDFLYIAAREEVRTHYLPAARSGIMQSHRVIASSLVARSTRAGLERISELPTFSGVMVDFMQRLILYEEDRATNKPMNALADALEREVLAGQIRTRKPSSGGYPEFVYRPESTGAGHSPGPCFVHGVRTRSGRAVSPWHRRP